jgi:hypothetical protein
MSEDKVRTKDPCWFVGTIYDPSELPGVSIAGPGLDGVLHFVKGSATFKPICIFAYLDLTPPNEFPYEVEHL